MEIEQWSKSEKAAARRAFDSAYEREVSSITNETRKKLAGMKESGDLWGLCDFLNLKRGELNDKYDFRYSVLLFVLARLVREGWVKREELSGLSEEKLNKIVRILSL